MTTPSRSTNLHKSDNKRTFAAPICNSPYIKKPICLHTETYCVREPPFWDRQRRGKKNNKTPIRHSSSRMLPASSIRRTYQQQCKPAHMAWEQKKTRTEKRNPWESVGRRSDIVFSLKGTTQLKQKLSVIWNSLRY